MLTNYLIVAAVLFCFGAIGFLSRRNMIVMFLSAEMMLMGVSLNFVSFSRVWGNFHGQVFTLFILTVAAAEAGIALALIVALYRKDHSLDISPWQDLREPGLPVIEDETWDEDLEAEPEPNWPKLTPSGRLPIQQSKEEQTHVR